MHEQKKINEAPTFEPKNPEIQILWAKDADGNLMHEYDLFKCDSFKEDKGIWARLRPGEEVPT